MGCDVTKKTICSVLKLNSNLRTLEWSINSCDLYLRAPPVSREDFKELLISFCSGLAEAFSGLECLAIRFPLLLAQFKIYVPVIINLGVPVICSELCLKKFTLQWLEVAENAFQCVEFVIEGSGFQFQKSDFSLYLNTREPLCSLPLNNLYQVLLNAVASELVRDTLQTVLLPYTLFIQTPEWGNHFKIMEVETSIVSLDLGALSLWDSDCLTAILSLQSLRYLNLSGMNISGHLLQLIATSSPNLEILNLQGCSGCLEPIQGLESLALCCPNLAELNLKGVHHQPSKETPNKLMEIISKFTHLVSLSLCTCVLGPTTENKTSKSNNDFDRDLLKRTKRVCHGTSGRLNSNDGPRPKSDGAAQSDSPPWDKLSSEESFDCLAKACSKITEFELIRPSLTEITSAFVKSYYKVHNSRPPVGQDNLSQCQRVTSAYDTLIALTNWTSLQRLTLAVPLMKGNLKPLVAVTQNCPNLHFLSLATLANIHHSGNVVLLQEALSNCRQLRDFRFEQPNFNITESFMLTLGELKELERVCIIAREGTMKIYSQTVISLFEKCCKLFYFQVLCDITVKASKSLKDSVMSRFAGARPGLVVSVVPFRQASNMALTCKIAKSIPVVHLKELFLFGTAVATRVPV